MRVIPKLIQEETSKFRYFSCKFRAEKSKEKAARIVLWREFDIMNCFTFEASFHGYLNEERVTEEFTPETYEKMGEHLAMALYEYLLILEEEDRERKIKELNKKKKKQRMKQERQQKKKKSKSDTNAVSKKNSPREASELDDDQDSTPVQNPNEPPTS